MKLHSCIRLPGVAQKALYSHCTCTSAITNHRSQKVFPGRLHNHALLLDSPVIGKDGEHGVDNVGTVPAALSTYLACQRFQPDLIISVGTAGGFKAQGAAIGDVFLGTTTVNHDRRIPIPVSFLSLLNYLPSLFQQQGGLTLILGPAAILS